MFLTISIHQFGWITERERIFLNLPHKEGDPSKKKGGPTWRKLWPQKLLQELASHELTAYLNLINYRHIIKSI